MIGIVREMARPTRSPLVAALALFGASCGQHPPQPHVLLITVDTLRADHLDAYGDLAVDTPALDAFLDAAVVFENSWTVVPITTPSLGSLLTSRTPRNHGAINNSYDLTSPDPTLAMALSEAGYRTGAFLPTFLADKPGFKRGFDRYDHPRLGEESWSGHEIVRRALSFQEEIEAEGGRWFVWVHLIEPHSPYAPGEELEAKYLPPGATPTEEHRSETYGEGTFTTTEEIEIIRALYRGDVELTDRCLEPMLERARDPGARILTVFTADHGEMMFEHANYFGHTAWLHEPILRVPLAFHHSDGSLPAARRTDPVTQLDVSATLLGQLGVPWHSPEGGLDLFTDEAPRDRMVIHETFAPESFRDKFAVRRGKWKMQVAAGGKWIKGSSATDFRQINDLAADPTESRAGDPGSAGAAFVDLQRRYQQWKAGQPATDSLKRKELDIETLRALEAMGYTQGFLRVNELDHYDPAEADG